MPIIAIFSGTFCREDAIVRSIGADTGYATCSDSEIVARANKLSGIPEGKISRVFSGRASVFNRFTHERERSIAYLKLALAQALPRNNLIVAGFSSLLIPRELNHVLRICLIADQRFRVSIAIDEYGVEKGEAAKMIRNNDEDRALWVQTLLKKGDPYDPSLYDILIPVHKTKIEEILALTRENLGKDVLQVTKGSEAALEDFLLSSRVEVTLSQEGHQVSVSAERGGVVLTINKHVLMLGRLEEELKSIACRVEGVRNVEVKVGPSFYQADIYRKYDFELPSKILLVDDEREFVQTLSERLSMRDMGSAVAYDGESALRLIREDEPEVMILDLRMPGIDGIEVLRRVKATQPEIEVVILTGHGSDADKETCMRLGAFAYLQKPVDIEVLGQTIQKANEKARLRKSIEHKKP